MIHSKHDTLLLTQQDYSEFTGVACILMALRWNKTEKRSKKCVNNWFAVSSQKSKYGMSQNLSQEEFCVRKEILKLLGTKSIWSIDLLIALYKLTNANHDISRPMTFPLSLLFCSANLGVDENYSNFTYYETSFAKDKFRVDKRFQLAKTLEIPMYLISNKIKGEPSAILLQHVINLLNRKDCIAIALIDNNILLRLQNAKEDNSDIIRPEDQPLETTCPYSGHYIILLGISTDISDIEIAIKNENGNIDDDEGYYFNECSPSSCIVITNPGSRKAVDYLTATHFESAWKSEGTDQDIIFLRQNGNNQLI